VRSTQVPRKTHPSMPPRQRRRPTPSMVVALIALFVALDGPAAAARLIDGRSIRANSVTSRQIRDHSLGAADLTRGAVRALQRTPNGSVGPKQLVVKAVDASKLADGAVGSTALADKAVGASDLADSAVGPAQLAQGAVTSTKVADGAIGAGAVMDGALQTRDIGDFYGSVIVQFKPFGPNECQVASFAPQAASAGGTPVIADDVVAVSPSTNGWPDPIVVTGNPGANNTLRIVACRVGGDPPALDVPNTTFQYVAFDAP
jgi:hypothetical protein